MDAVPNLMAEYINKGFYNEAAKKKLVYFLLIKNLQLEGFRGIKRKCTEPLHYEWVNVLIANDTRDRAVI